MGWFGRKPKIEKQVEATIKAAVAGAGGFRKPRLNGRRRSCPSITPNDSNLPSIRVGKAEWGSAGASGGLQPRPHVTACLGLYQPPDLATPPPSRQAKRKGKPRA
jgi:hypothetical protein